MVEEAVLKSILGRIPAAPVVLPDISYEAKALAEWLRDAEGSQRRPDATAKILALAVRLHLDDCRPWPTRQQVKEHLGVSLPMIDVVMSARQARGQIKIWTSTIQGNIQKHASVITLRHIQLSQELIDVVERALKEHKRAMQRVAKKLKSELKPEIRQAATKPRKPRPKPARRAKGKGGDVVIEA